MNTLWRCPAPQCLHKRMWRGTAGSPPLHAENLKPPPSLDAVLEVDSTAPASMPRGASARRLGDVPGMRVLLLAACVRVRPPLTLTSTYALVVAGVGWSREGNSTAREPPCGIRHMDSPSADRWFIH